MTTLEEIGKHAYSYPETIQNSYDLAVKMINNQIEGDFVECGIAAGAQLMAMALANKENSGSKKIWGFDSFQGIPMAGEFDDVQVGIGEITHDKFAPLSERLISSGITVHSLESVISNFTNKGLYDSSIRFVKGWFQNTLPEIADQVESISILRLDGDLYESTLVCLEYLYPKVSKGGAVIVDDYLLTGCRVAVEHYFKSIDEPVPEMICVDGNMVHYFIK
jgi:O-methyltransferase